MQEPTQIELFPNLVMNLWSHEWKADLAELSKSEWFLINHEWCSGDSIFENSASYAMQVCFICISLLLSVLGLFTFNVICKDSASWIHCFMNATEFLVTAEFPLSVAPQTITNNEKVILPGIIGVLSCNIWYLADEIKMKFTKLGQSTFTTTKPNVALIDIVFGKVFKGAPYL